MIDKNMEAWLEKIKDDFENIWTEGGEKITAEGTEKMTAAEIQAELERTHQRITAIKEKAEKRLLELKDRGESNE